MLARRGICTSYSHSGKRQYERCMKRPWNRCDSYAFAALPGAVRRPPRSARRRGAARSSCAAAGCWCPAPAPPPSRERCAQQPRAAGALCPLRRRAAATREPARTPGSPAATQIAQQPHRAATRHFSSPPETRTARGSCLYLPAGDRHPPRPIWKYRLRHLTLAAGTVFFLNSYSRVECSYRRQLQTYR